MDVVIWGGRGHAKVLRECLSHDGHVVAAVVDNDPGVDPPWPGVPLLAGWPALRDWQAGRRSAPGFVVAVGGDRGTERLQLHEELLAAGFLELTARHPSAFVADNASLGPGTQVLALGAVAVEAALGRCCIINTAAAVDHESVLGDGVHLGPGARLAGNVSVGDFAFLGTGAIVLPRVRIGVGAIVGAGAVVTRDVPDGAVVAGNPARLLRRRA